MPVPMPNQQDDHNPFFWFWETGSQLSHEQQTAAIRLGFAEGHVLQWPGRTNTRSHGSVFWKSAGLTAASNPQDISDWALFGFSPQNWNAYREPKKNTETAAQKLIRYQKVEGAHRRTRPESSERAWLRGDVGKSVGWGWGWLGEEGEH